MQREQRELRTARRWAAELMRERLQPPTRAEWEAVELEREGRLIRLDSHRQKREDPHG